MNDAEYIFNQTSRERKRNGYGDYHKKRQGGRQIRLPSDHLSKKELAALNSDVTKINLNAPVDWCEFKNWPNDLKIEYLQRLENKYHATTEDIAEMMGVGYKPLVVMKRDLGIASKRGGRRPKLDLLAWGEFCHVDVNTVKTAVEKCPEAPEVPAEKSPASAIIELQKEAAEAEEKAKASSLGNLMNIALLLDTLKGSGAKLTIEVTL